LAVKLVFGKVRRRALDSNKFLQNTDAMRRHRTGHIEQHGNSKPWNTSCNWFVVCRPLLELLVRVIEESSYKHVFADMPAFWFSLNYVNTLHYAI
jgi:hypothetical protein